MSRGLNREVERGPCTAYWTLSGKPRCGDCVRNGQLRSRKGDFRPREDITSPQGVQSPQMYVKQKGKLVSDVLNFR
jgi:hypothetical protein